MLPTIFDKSFLESLTLDEAVWFDNFFLSNITPIFYVETLADLEKKGKKGKVSRTPEELVEELANKTPVMHSVPNIFHLRLVVGNLLGQKVEMSDHHRPIISGGQYNITPDGKLGVDFKQFPEAAALERWRRHEFLEIERKVAKNWRKSLTNLNFDSLIDQAKSVVPSEARIAKLEDVKKFADSFVKGRYNQLIHLALNMLDVPEKAKRPILKRWYATRPMPFDEFAPFAAHVLKIDLFFYLCLDKSLIAKERPSNKIDISYLYYLPFCSVFVSSDKLHLRTVPLFVENGQSFVTGKELKEDLKKLNEYYAKLPDKIKERGLMEFAVYPPDDQETLVGNLYDKHLKSSWRKSAKVHRQSWGKPKKFNNGIVEELKKKQSEQKPLVGSSPSSDMVDSISITRRIPAKRGSWMILPLEVIKKSGKTDPKP
ncbi:MAG: hypothetical protein KatS3mg101_0089 [Patescibacteria group bacterium]|nr:MAG: hypothetical protein KatS3mg101_0089 [Patescibacteria group bacterium]